jgi:hypothetical protein
MIGHSHTSTSTEHPKLPNEPFFSWLRDQTALLVSQVPAVLTSVYLLAALVYYVAHVGERSADYMRYPTILLSVDYAHLIVLGLFIIMVIGFLEDNERGSYRVGVAFRRIFGKDLEPRESARRLDNSKAQLRLFKRYFLWFWCLMLLLYISFAFSDSVEGFNGSHFDEPWLALELAWRLTFPTLGLALNNLSLLYLFLCFLVLSSSSDHNAELSHKRSRWLCLAVIIVLTALFPAFNALNFCMMGRDAHFWIFGVNAKEFIESSTIVFNAISGPQALLLPGGSLPGSEGEDPPLPALLSLA